MTDITDQDRRDAREWAEDVAETFKYDDEVPRETRAAVNYILATVDATAPTLSEELRTINIDQLDESTLDYLADRAEKIEQERDQARSEVKYLDSEVERLSAGEAVNEPVTHHSDASMTDLPDPTDVPPGEAWLVRDEQELSIAVRDAERWILIHLKDATTRYRRIQHITLITRLVPAPRTITDADELGTLAEGTIVRGGDGHAWENVAGKWCGHRAFGAISAGALTHSGPVTVLWTPGETE